MKYMYLFIIYVNFLFISSQNLRNLIFERVPERYKILTEAACKTFYQLYNITIDFKDRKFDYITLIGVFEYAAVYTKTENPYIDFLEKIIKLLKPDGKILIAIENKFGMKYWLGAPEDHTNVKYDGITGYQNDNTIRTFGKREL